MPGGYVLAGGRSSRMGVNKALLELDGQTLLLRAALRVRDAAGTVTIVGPRALYQSLGFPLIEDAFEGAGPLGGIEAALRHTAHDWNLIVACDMPDLHSTVLRGLLRTAEDHPEADVIWPIAGGRAQPLCAVYHRRALPACEDALRAGRFKVVRAFEGQSVMAVEMCDPDVFRNVNTPEDWERLQPAIERR